MRERFTKDLQQSSIPYKSIIKSNKGLEELLFKQYKATKKVPSLSVYLEKAIANKALEAERVNGEYYTLEERQKIKHFYSLPEQEKQKYLSHDIRETPTYKALASVKKGTSILLDLDSARAIEQQVKDIVQALKPIKSYTNLVYECILTDLSTIANIKLYSIEANKKVSSDKLETSLLEIKSYFEKFISEVMSEPKGSNKKKKQHPKTLLECFRSSEEYDRLIKLLEYHKFIKDFDKSTNTWKWDETVSYKSELGALLNDLKDKGYYENKPRQEDMVKICKNTFRTNISIDHIKRSPKEFSAQGKVFIPFPNDLKKQLDELL